MARHGCLYTTHPVNDAVPASDPLQPCPTRRRPWPGPTGRYASDTDGGWWWGTGRPQQTGMGLSAAIAAKPATARPRSALPAAAPVHTGTGHTAVRVGTPLCRLCGRLDDLISEPTRAVGATVTEGTVILIALPRMAR